MGMVLNACTSSTISTQRLKEDILGLKELALVTKINTMSVISKSESSTRLQYKISTELEAYNYTSIMDITLVYTKKDGSWAISDSQVEQISISAKSDPSTKVAVKSAIKEVSDGLVDHWTLFGGDPTYTLVSSTGSKEAGDMTLVIGERFVDEYMTIEVNYTVDAVFMHQTGWNFTLKDWICTETMKWAGTFDLNWTLSVPGFPSQETSKYFVEGDQIKDILITGDAVRIRKMDKTKTIQNSLRIQFTYKGKNWDVKPNLDSVVTWIDFQYMESDPHSIISFQYRPLSKAYGEPQYVPFTADEAYMIGVLARHP